MEPRLSWQQQIMHHFVYYMGSNVHAKFPLHCFILSRDMYGFVFWPLQTHPVTSSIPNLRVRRNLNISERKKDIAKRKNAILLFFERPFQYAYF